MNINILTKKELKAAKQALNFFNIIDNDDINEDIKKDYVTIIIYNNKEYAWYLSPINIDEEIFVEVKTLKIYADEFHIQRLIQDLGDIIEKYK